MKIKLHFILLLSLLLAGATSIGASYVVECTFQVKVLPFQGRRKPMGFSDLYSPMRFKVLKVLAAGGHGPRQCYAMKGKTVTEKVMVKDQHLKAGRIVTLAHNYGSSQAGEWSNWIHMPPKTRPGQK